MRQLSLLFALSLSLSASQLPVDGLWHTFGFVKNQLGPVAYPASGFDLYCEWPFTVRLFDEGISGERFRVTVDSSTVYDSSTVNSPSLYANYDPYGAELAWRRVPADELSRLELVLPGGNHHLDIAVIDSPRQYQMGPTESLYDSGQISATMIVPEPGTWALVLCGLLVRCAARSRSKRRTISFYRG